VNYYRPFPEPLTALEISMRIKQGQDPVFKDRVLINNPSFPGIQRKSGAGKWVGAVLLASSLGGAAYYFYPTSNTTSQPVPATPVETVAAKPSEVKPTLKPSTAAHKAHEPSKPAVVAAPQPDTAESLLNKARGQIAKLRLTSPEGDNAYATYQALMKLDPKQAQSILDEIVGWYVEQNNKLIEKEKFSEAHKNYEKLRELAPQHSSVPKLFDDILLALKHRIEVQLAAEHVLLPKNDSAFAHYQELHNLAPEQAATKQVLQKLVTALMSKVKKQVFSEHYLSPKDDNAFDTYQVLLKIAPEHKEVKEAVVRMAKRLHTLATQEEKANKLKDGLETVHKALKLAPEDKPLLQLQARLETEKTGKKTKN
jgi:tetratricopeptide (TPR) repeat protein